MVTERVERLAARVKSHPRSVRGFGALALVASVVAVPMTLAAPAAKAAPDGPVIGSISVASATSASDPCTGQPAEAVLVVGTCDSINSDGYGSLGTLSDEHSTILAPGTLGPSQTDYLFFVASHTSLNPTSSGLVVLQSSGPNLHNRWQMSFAPGYGEYDQSSPSPGQRYGQMFLSPTLHPDCPTAASQAAENPGFDLNYADPGEVVVDPTQPQAGGLYNMLMVYEGSNRCIGLTGGDNLDQGPPDNQGNPTANNFHGMDGIATSTDSGQSWPSYSYDQPNALPNQSSTQGPPSGEALGAIGTGVCRGDDCAGSLPADYGRYAVVGPPTSLSEAMANTTIDSQGYLSTATGDAAPSAFVDDLAAGTDPYLYVVNDYLPGDPALDDAPEPTGTNPNSDLVVSRAQLNGGAAPLAFSQWGGRAFGSPAAPGTPNTAAPSPIFQPDRAGWTGSYQNCEDAQLGAAGVPEEAMTEGQISYVDATHQYLLT